ncbi:alpha/beta fold hydrolase [Chengkuizengella marina]|uniref:Alpha/beta hydrolase n=1 Tax=Chengkuizengella marina TaxID=2507566 RepID=A0A6N9Q5X3_9BACL|nr:alpha/beta hydrolase [Chengkuizengella marina]NBI30227.1 alpha/beta hydrolase [Chengkuizengella marina]
MDLNYEVHGTGEPIVMIHSPGVDMREWKYIVPHLAQTNEVVIFDGRGAGKSPAPVEPSDFVNDVLRLIDHLGIEKATLVGHSMGGQIATDFTLTYPDKVKKLVLISPSLTGFKYSSEFTEWMQKVNSVAPDVEKLVEMSLSGPNYSITMSSPHQGFLYEMTRHYMNKVFTEWKNFEIIWPEPPAIERLHEIKASTLFIQGDKEWEDLYRISEHFKQVQSIRFIIVEGADHMVTLTHPEKIVNYIDLFLHQG